MNAVIESENSNIDEAINNPVMIHFVGPIGRPWFKETKNYFVKKYDYYESLLPFKKRDKESFFNSDFYRKSSFFNKIKLKIIVLLYNTRIFGKYHTIKNKY